MIHIYTNFLIPSLPSTSEFFLYTDEFAVNSGLSKGLVQCMKIYWVLEIQLGIWSHDWCCLWQGHLTRHSLMAEPIPSHRTQWDTVPCTGAASTWAGGVATCPQQGTAEVDIVHRHVMGQFSELGDLIYWIQSEIHICICGQRTSEVGRRVCVYTPVQGAKWTRAGKEQLGGGENCLWNLLTKGQSLYAVALWQKGTNSPLSWLTREQSRGDQAPWTGFNLFKERKHLNTISRKSFMKLSSQPLWVTLLKRLPCFTALNLLWTEY